MKSETVDRVVEGLKAMNDSSWALNIDYNRGGSALSSIDWIWAFLLH